MICMHVPLNNAPTSDEIDYHIYIYCTLNIWLHCNIWNSGHNVYVIINGTMCNPAGETSMYVCLLKGIRST